MRDKYIQESHNIGANLKWLRFNRGLTLSKLSKEIGIPKGTLGYLECGYSKPSIERQNLLANYYDISTEDLFMDHIEFMKKYGDL